MQYDESDKCYKCDREIFSHIKPDVFCVVTKCWCKKQFSLNGFYCEQHNRDDDGLRINPPNQTPICKSCLRSNIRKCESRSYNMQK